MCVCVCVWVEMKENFLAIFCSCDLFVKLRKQEMGTLLVVVVTVAFPWLQTKNATIRKAKWDINGKYCVQLTTHPKIVREPIHTFEGGGRGGEGACGMGKVNFLVMQNKYYETYYTVMSLCECVWAMRERTMEWAGARYLQWFEVPHIHATKMPTIYSPFAHHDHYHYHRFASKCSVLFSRSPVRTHTHIYTNRPFGSHLVWPIASSPITLNSIQSIVSLSSRNSWRWWASEWSLK